MSFPKAPLKRFNEHVGCAPAPGSYDVKISDGLKGPVSFEKSQRFRPKKDSNGDSQSLDEADCTSPVRLRKHSSLGSTPNLKSKPEKDPEFLKEMKKQKKLEKEIRSLLKERAEQDKRLQTLEEEFKKTEAKLVTAVRERTSLSANMASLERQIADLNKANDHLKAKFSDDSSKKRINSLCTELIEAKNKVDSKDKEINCLQASFEEQIKMLQINLESSKATLNSLKERNTFLEESNQETNVHSTALEKELNQVQVLIEELRGENQNLQGYLSDAQEQLQDLRMEFSSKEQEFENKLELATSQMSEQSVMAASKQKETEELLHESRITLEQTLQKVSQLEEQLILASGEKCKLAEEKVETERKLSASLEEMGAFIAQAEYHKLQLEQTVELLKQRDQEHLFQKNLFTKQEEELLVQVNEQKKTYSILLQEKEKFETGSKETEQKLNAELDVLKQAVSQREDALQAVQKSEAELRVRLQKEEEISSSLRLELQQVQEEEMNERHLLEEELEGTLDEFDRLQLQEEQADKIIAELEEENKQRAEELVHLEETLKGKNAELERAKEKHRLAILKLKEEQSDRILKLAEYESDRVSAAAEIEILQSTNLSLLEKVAEFEQAKEITTKQKAELEQQLRDLKEASSKEKEELEQQIQNLSNAFSIEKAKLYQQLHDLRKISIKKEELEQQVQNIREASAIEKVELEKQLHDLQEAAFTEKAEFEQQFHEFRESSTKAKEALEQQLHDLRETSTKAKEELEQQLFELHVTESAAKEELVQQLHELKETSSKTKEELEHRLHKLQESSSTIKKELEQQLLETSAKTKMESEELHHELEAMGMQLSFLKESTVKTEEEYTRRLRDAEAKLQTNEAENRKLQEEHFTKESMLEVQVEQLQQELEKQQQEIEILREESEKEKLDMVEVNKWRTLFEELQNKVRPFQQQLDAFEAEKNALLNEHGAAQDELNKLSEAYAKLLGHQNQKQKIKHVMKLKTENIQLKQEASRLRSQLVKEKHVEKQLQDHLNDLQGVKRFDPSKAFQHESKENIYTKVPLREGNRKKY